MGSFPRNLLCSALRHPGPPNPSLNLALNPLLNFRKRYLPIKFTSEVVKKTIFPPRRTCLSLGVKMANAIGHWAVPASAAASKVIGFERIGGGEAKKEEASGKASLKKIDS